MFLIISSSLNPNSNSIKLGLFLKDILIEKDIHYDFLDSWIVRWARFKGMRVNCYTINNGTIYKKAIKAKIDGIFTDNIEYIK